MHKSESVAQKHETKRPRFAENRLCGRTDAAFHRGGNQHTCRLPSPPSAEALDECVGAFVWPLRCTPPDRWPFACGCVAASRHLDKKPVTGKYESGLGSVARPSKHRHLALSDRAN